VQIGFVDLKIVLVIVFGLSTEPDTRKVLLYPEEDVSWMLSWSGSGNRTWVNTERDGLLTPTK
jgi:hypothetical protein